MPGNGRPLAVLWKPATTRQNLSANLKAVRELIGVGAHSNQPTHGKDVLTVTLTELVVLAGASRTLFLGQVDDVSFAADDGEERWQTSSDDGGGVFSVHANGALSPPCHAARPRNGNARNAVSVI